ncbi:MAG TPA: aminotransferase class V-fold PLP-dependent enzyme [Vicinamibacterales bacterium]|nr:aminotransferase class V-fold PLP-dependent enzyme [Vicinamibacterales bacterium]
MIGLTRRSFLGTAGATGVALVGARALVAASVDGAQAALQRPAGSADAVARDEAYWRRVAAQYRVSSQFTNLEAGYFGMMAAPVLAAYHRNIDRVNLDSSFYARRQFPAEFEAARARVAAFLGVTPAEVVLTRGATEALQCLIVQYNKIRPGDVVMYADLDYNAMQFAMNWLVERRGATVAKLVIPEPATRDTVLAAYADALAANPRVKLLLLTHLNNKTGLIIPVKEIAAMARARGADVIVDAAHSFGQVDLTMADIGADFVGCNLHKWIGAPVGVGVMYIKAGRLPDIDRRLADEGDARAIDSRVHTGTSNFATMVTVPAALDFHDAVGPAHKAARIRYLRDRWVKAVRGVPGIDVLTPDDPDLVAGITSFRLHGRTSRADNQALAAELLDRYGLFTFWRTGLAKGDCVRATPALYNTPEDVDRLAAALKAIAARG